MSQESNFPIQKLLRLIYVHNPFYLISACLFVYGLKAFFRPDNMDFLYAAGSVGYIDPWYLMGSLCGVTLLMATTAYLIVRFGKVWEDARSLVLVLLLMFLAISVSFDEIIALVSFKSGSSLQAMGLMTFGGAFSIAVAEMLLRGLKIKLPIAFRVPLHALLALFFAFPMWVCPEVTSASPEQARWRVAVFPTIAAMISLALLPAIRLGSKSVQDNGTPWSWPWFPWSVFAFLGGAVVFRSYSLAISFDRADARAHFWDSSFGLYFLIPVVLSTMILLLEVAIVEELHGLKERLVRFAPAVLLLSYPWLGPWTRHVTYTRFAYEFVAEVGSPVFLTLLAMLVFYAVAWWRQIKHADLGVFGCLMALVFIGRSSFGASTFTPTVEHLHAWPLIALGAIWLKIGIGKRQTLATFLGAIALSFSTGIMAIGTPLDSWKVSIAYHLIVLSTLVVGLCFKDSMARWLRRWASWLLTLSGSFCVAIVCARTMTAEIFAYSAVIAIAALIAWRLCAERRFLFAALLNLSSSVLFGGIRSIHWVEQLTIPAGVTPLLWAAACFVVAVGISSLKGGIAKRLVKQEET